MMVFADTNHFVALLSPRDQYHHRAVAASKQQNKVFTSEFVLLEVGNFFLLPAERQKFVHFCNLLRNDQNIVIVPVTTTWFQRGLDLFAKRPDKEWSLTDCISFEIMADHQLTHALTADHHFVQAGFTIEFP